MTRPKDKNAVRTKRRFESAAVIADMPNHRIAGRRAQLKADVFKRLKGRAGK